LTEQCSEPVTVRGSFRRWLLLGALLQLLLRLPLCWDAGSVRNDGAEYLAIARSLRTTGRYATDLKYHFYSGDPVRHSAWADRPPLYPVVAALSASTLPVDPTAAARLTNAGLAAAAWVLAVLYLRRLYGERLALLAASYVFILPLTLYWTGQPMTESLSLLLGFAALLTWDRAREGHTARQALAAGLLAGLAYLMRPTGALLLIVFLADAFRRRPVGAPQRLTPNAQALLMGFALCAVPYHLQLWHTYGSPFHSALAFTFAVDTYYDVTYFGFERPPLTAMQYLRQYGSHVPGLILNQAWHHLQAIALPLLGLLPVAVAAPLAGEVQGEAPVERLWASRALIALTLVVHTVTWSAWGSSRYFLLVLVLLAAEFLAGFGRRSRATPEPGARRLLPAVTTLGLLMLLVRFYAEQLPAERGTPDIRTWKAAARDVEGARLIASDRPATLNLLLETPAVMLPRMTDREQMERFAAAYGPDVMVLFPHEPQRAAAEAMAAAWRAGRLPRGWELTRDTGAYLVARRSAQAPAAAP
jgi:4-amino-4-deoxy-L-arabinose transferase-like glycosyltransferase